MIEGEGRGATEEGDVSGKLHSPVSLILHNLHFIALHSVIYHNIAMHYSPS